VRQRAPIRLAVVGCQHLGSQIIGSMLSAAVGLLSSVVVVILWQFAFEEMTSALSDSHHSMRRQLAEMAARKVATLLYFGYSLTVNAEVNMRGISFDHAMFAEQATIDALAPRWFAAINPKGLHSRVDSNGGNARSHDVIAQGVIYAGMPPERMGECVSASFATVVRGTGGDGAILSDRQFRSAETNSTVRQLHSYNVDQGVLGPVIAPGCSSAEGAGLSPPACVPELDCLASMASLWRATSLSGFDDFAWYGPYDPQVGWGYHFEGNLPLRDADGVSVGRIATAISLKGITRLLADQIATGGTLLQDAHMLIFTRHGTHILANTEAEGDNSYKLGVANCSDSSGCSLGALPVDSVLARALDVVRSLSDGDACPSTNVLSNATALFLRERDEAPNVTREYFVQSHPFQATSYGMPPLPERWCILTAIPADNLLGRVQRANVLSTYVGVTSTIGVLFAMASLGLAINYMRKRMLVLEREKCNAEDAFVSEAIASASQISFPLAVVRASDVLEQNRFWSHERLRDAGKLTFLNNQAQIKHFKARGQILFVSHQWLSASSPDVENVQFRALRVAVDELLRRGALSKERELYLWMDYASIPQDHRALMQAAIGALPAYASQADVFLILAPEAVNPETHKRSGLVSYERRGWCRAEVFAKVCGSGLKNTFIFSQSSPVTTTPLPGNDAAHADDVRTVDVETEAVAQGGTLHALSDTDLDTFSLFVFEGEFSQPSDRQNLVKPILGLYALTLGSYDPWLVSVRLFINANKERFFPTEELRADGSTAVLFGRYVERLESKLLGARLSGSRATSISYIGSRKSLSTLEAADESPISGRGSASRWKGRASRQSGQNGDECGVYVAPGTVKLGAIAALVNAEEINSRLTLRLSVDGVISIG
jgi:hypothetical protein